jgi:hypothetical protein
MHRSQDASDFASYPNGDVGWAFAWTDMATIKIMRVLRCP